MRRGFNWARSQTSFAGHEEQTSGAFGSSIHQLREAEAEAAKAYRVQRYSLAAAAVFHCRDGGWTELVHRTTTKGAIEHATACLESYRVARLIVYTHVRVIDSTGKEIWKEAV